MDILRLIRSDPRVRPKPFSFKPPKTNRLVCALAKKIIPIQLRKKLKVVDVAITDDDLARLRELKGKRCLLMPSHSGGFEPYVVMHVAKLLNDNYNYMAAMEAFEQHSFFMGWFMQRLGAYSIIRGTADRQSFQTTRKLLVAAKRWLVIFPEGQTVWQNDTVIPFQQGVTQIAFKAYEEAAKADPNASLHCIPMAIKYVYLKNMDREIDASLTRLESQLLPADGPGHDGPMDRLIRISEAVLMANEKKHNIKPPPDTNRNERIQRMKEHIVAGIERQLGITPRPDQAMLDRIRAAFCKVDKIVLEEAETTDYERKLMDERRQAASDLYDDLWRVLQFIAIYAGYVRESMTAERFLDALCLLEKEVFNERRMWGPRRALVKVGDPVDLKDHFVAYKENKRQVNEDVTLSLESTVRDMLETLSRQSGKVTL